MPPDDVDAIADRLIDAYDNATTLEPMSTTLAEFDTEAAYAVLDRIAERRVAAGWVPVGRKIGFTNRNLWSLFEVDQPMWAHLWSTTVAFTPDNQASMPLSGLVQPRLEPEVVFKLGGAPPPDADATEILRCVEWMAPAFEVVHCHFPAWNFRLADCIADFGLHGALVVGTPVVIDDENREAVGQQLPAFELTLARDFSVVDRGVGANVLDGPAHALSHLNRVLAEQPAASPLVAGEVITTGTITNAWQVGPGEQWTSDYGALGLDGLTIAFS
jgi:2-oxo-3-hexenedioate decarboxylase